MFVSTYFISSSHLIFSPASFMTAKTNRGSKRGRPRMPKEVPRQMQRTKLARTRKQQEGKLMPLQRGRQLESSNKPKIEDQPRVTITGGKIRLLGAKTGQLLGPTRRIQSSRIAPRRDLSQLQGILSRTASKNNLLDLMPKIQGKIKASQSVIA